MARSRMPMAAILVFCCSISIKSVFWYQKSIQDNQKWYISCVTHKYEASGKNIRILKLYKAAILFLAKEMTLVTLKKLNPTFFGLLGP